MRSPWFILLIATGCSSAPKATEPASPTAPLGVSIKPQVHDTLAVDSEPVPAQPSTEARQFLGTVNELDRTKPRADHERVVEALRALDAVLEPLTPDQRGDLDRLREATRQLDQSDPHALSHAAFVRTALDAARRALAATRPPPPADLARFKVEVAAMRDEVMKLSPDVPLLDEYGQLRSAFQAAARAVFAGEGATEPTFETETISAER